MSVFLPITAREWIDVGRLDREHGAVLASDPARLPTFAAPCCSAIRVSVLRHISPAFLRHVFGTPAYLLKVLRFDAPFVHPCLNLANRPSFFARKCHLDLEIQDRKFGRQFKKPRHASFPWC